MTEITVKAEKTYTISNLTFGDMELICLGLELTEEPDMYDRKTDILYAIDAAL